MKNINYKKILPHIAAITILIIVSLIYFSPIFSGKQLIQSDMMSFPGMTKAMDNYTSLSGNTTEWTPNMFSGMPSYQLKYGDNGNIIGKIAQIFYLEDKTNSFGVFFLLALGMYIFMVCMGARSWTALFAGLIYALGSYNIIIIGVGHITKALAMAMIAPVLGGMILAFRKKYTSGFILFTISLAFQLSFNHVQITYYTLIAAVIMGVNYLIFAIKDKEIKNIAKSFGVLILGAILSLLPVAGHFMVNQEYVKHTMRGGSELTVHPKTAKHDINNKGLDINYAFNWSYGKSETFTLLVPDFMGGGSADTRISKENSKLLRNRMQAFQTNTPIERDENKVNQIANQYFGSTYHGTQPFTAGPVYFGAVICFLALLGFIVIDNKWRWWLLAATIISILLSWGSNFMSLNSWLFYHLPMYNKFRTPSMALVLANVTMIMAAFLGLKAFLQSTDKKKKNTALYVSAAIVGGITLFAALFPSLFSSFSTPKDEIFAKTLGENFIIALQQDREALFVSDAWRSFIFIALCFAAIMLYQKKVFKKEIILILCVGMIGLIDMWGVGRRYINKDSFRPKSERMMVESEAIRRIEENVEKANISHFRVYNLVSNPFNESTTSYYLPSIGGYSAAKLQRYQDIIDFYLTNTSYKQNDLNDTSLIRHNPLRQVLYQYKDAQGFPMPNIGVLNMLDTKYIIVGNEQYLENTEALGACWLVDSIHWAKNADEEILSMDNFNPKTTAIINLKYKDQIKSNITKDSNAKITFVPNEGYNDINHLKYKFSSSSPQLAVFSEIYYRDGWQCYLDGKKVDYLNTDYILRGLYVPAGSHEIEFVNGSNTLKAGKTISYIGSILLLLSIATIIAFPYIKNKAKKEVK